MLGTFLVAIAALLAAGQRVEGMEMSDKPLGLALNDNLALALMHADRVVSCQFRQFDGTFFGEGLWQSGNTLETLSSLMLAVNYTRWAAVLEDAYEKTKPIVDNCFDDHQWWLLAWVRAYELTNITKYVQRAANVFDFVVKNAWTAQCGGGVIWCPTSAQTTSRFRALFPAADPTNGPYKNAITNELFLSSAMALHPYTKLVGKPAGFYLDWARREWSWFAASGMIGASGLINDGLTDQCASNNQTTWTYNQGVLLSGLARLAHVTGNASYAQAAVRTARAAMTLLIAGGVFREPCTSCDQDQHLFKGIFVRHLAYAHAVPEFSSLLPNVSSFLTTNAAAMRSNAQCANGAYGMLWQGPACVDADTASESSALDLLLAAGLAGTQATRSPQQEREETSDANAWLKGEVVLFKPLGLGNCADASGHSMANCASDKVNASTCASVAASVDGVVGYDHQILCTGSTFCRIRTLAGKTACPNGWAYEDGAARDITGVVYATQTLCYVKAA
jgi:hypothetical protein